MNASRMSVAVCLALGLFVTATAMADSHMKEKGMPESVDATMSPERFIEQVPSETLIGKRIVNTDKEKIGVVKSVLRDPSTEETKVIVSVGGFLGIGATKIAVPLTDVRTWGNHLSVQNVGTEKELMAMPEYAEGGYVQVPAREVLNIPRMGEVASRTGGGPGSFERLDSDGSGYLSREEAALEPAMKGRWDQLDTNSDDRIDTKEFSAFEEDTKSAPAPRGGRY